MANVTLVIAGIAVVLVYFLPPRYGLLFYLVTLLCYPDYISIIVFGCNFSVGRFVVLALLTRCLLDQQLRCGFRWTRLDTLIIIADVVYILVLSCNCMDTVAAIKCQSGVIVNTTFAYFSIRLIINNRAVLIQTVQVVALILVVMAFLGVFEAVTTISPYKGLMKYSFIKENSPVADKFKGQETFVGHGQEERFGFFRAQGPQGHPILFGASFALLLPLVWKVLYNTRWKSLRVPFCGAIIAGGASSMSSTPFSGLLIALAGLIFERFERWGKHLFVLFVLWCVFTEFYSEKSHFYAVFISRLSFGGGDGYFRIRLIDVALKHLPEYWLTGYGLSDPGFGHEIDGVNYTDLCVHYVYLAVMYGVFGLLAYLAIVFNLIFSLWRKYRRSVATFDRNICWALIVSIVATLILDLGVTPFGTLPSLYSIIFGIGASVISPTFKSQNGIRDTSALLAVRNSWR